MAANRKNPVRLLVLALMLALPTLAPAALLTVEELDGTVSVTRNQAERLLSAGDALQEGDALHVSQDARVLVRISRHGFFELGSESELILERVPASTYSEDLNTSLQLDRGFMRMVWQYAGTSSTWPLFVHFGDQRASLRSGEYFLEAAAEGSLPFCVADGEAAVGIASSTRPPRLFNGPACYSLRAGGERQKRKPEDFIALRTWLSFAGQMKQEASEPAVPRAEVPAPSPVVSSADVTKKKGWTVNVISSVNAEAAARDAAKLRAGGLVAAVVTAEVDGKQWHRVQLGPVSSREAAVELSKRAKALGYAEAWLQKP